MTLEKDHANKTVVAAAVDQCEDGGHCRWLAAAAIELDEAIADKDRKAFRAGGVAAGIHNQSANHLDG